MQTTITGQTTLENGQIVFGVHFIDGQEERYEQYVYPSVSAVLRRLRRDKEKHEEAAK